MSEISLQDFTNGIEARTRGVDETGQPLLVSDEVIMLQDGGSSARVRLAGGHVLDVFLAVDEDAAAVPVLYSGVDSGELPPNVPKLNATFFMEPVGPQEGLGGQHGFWRYADSRRLKTLDTAQYVVTDADTEAEPTWRTLLESQTPDVFPCHMRDIKIQDGTFTIRDVLFNTDEERHTSVGQHLYWVLNADPSAPLSHEGVSVTDIQGDPLFSSETLRKAFDGDSQYVPDAPNVVTIGFPDGRTFIMKVALSMFDKNRQLINSDIPIGYLGWRRQDTNSFCIEPVSGMQTNGDGPVAASELGNQGLTLPPGAILDFETIIFEG